MAQLGQGVLFVAFALALFGIALNIIGERRNIPELSVAGVRSVVGIAVLLVVASAILLIAFVTHDFSFAYVSARSGTDMPMRYVATAFYGGQEGSLLAWSFFATTFASIAFARNRARFPRLVPYAAATFLTLISFFLFVLTFVVSPFRLNPVTPLEGVGLNPLLRDDGMLIHPPLLLAGFASLAVPFSIAVGALVSGRMTTEWLRYVRRWALVSWAVLGAGIFIGGWWAYHVLGWGGYWGWDPVENVSLLPWLTMTAFIHSIMVQERRGMLKVWNVSLLLMSYVLAIFGTFIVRSGIIQSVHSFATSSVGIYFLAFLGAVMLLSVSLILYRMPMMRSENSFDAVLSRESSFLLNNLLFTGIVFATFWGTIYPLVSEALNGERLTVGPPFYKQVNGPLLLLLLILMGVGPLLAWRRSTAAQVFNLARVPLLLALVAVIGVLALFGQPLPAIAVAAVVFAIGAVLVEYWKGAQLRRKNAGESLPFAVVRLARRDPRRYGGYVVHLGIAIMAIGIIGSQFFQTERRVILQPGESVNVAEYTLQYIDLIEQTQSDGRSVTARVSVATNGNVKGVLNSRRYFYRGFENQPTTLVAVKTFGFDDVYVVLTEWSNAGAVNLHIFINPLVSWVWAGGAVFLFGMVVIFWPAGATRRVPARAAVREGALREATN